MNNIYKYSKNEKMSHDNEIAVITDQQSNGLHNSWHHCHIKAHMVGGLTINRIFIIFWKKSQL